MSATTDLLDFAGADPRLPPNVRDDAIRLLGDTLAVGAAGVGAPGEPEVCAVAHGFGNGDEARLLGTAQRLPAASAAFVNGYRIHCLEWDAVHEPAVVHALSVVVAALGAAIDRREGCDPETALVALAVGVDVAAGLGVSADSDLRFFRPATAGLLGAAIAVARIDHAPMADALGLAYSSAAGTMQAHVEGSPALPFQIANAARAALVASDLARAGFSAPKDPLEGPFGYFALFERGDLARYTRDLGAFWRISEVSVKPYPSGRASHAALGKLAELRPDPAMVERVELACPPLVRRLVGRDFNREMSPAYARLCLPWLAALMLAEGRIDPRRFTPEAMADPALGVLAAKVVLVDDGNPDPNALFPQHITIAYTDGRSEGHEIAHTLGSPANPLDKRQVATKHGLARELAPADADARIFSDPLAYFTDPR